MLRKSLVALMLAAAAVFSGLRASWGATEPKPVRKPLKVLAIGNSFSICVVREFSAVARDLDLPLDICSLYVPGCSLETHMKNVRAPETKPYKVTWSYVTKPRHKPSFVSLLSEPDEKGFRFGNIPQMLAADRWDIVTIQQASGLSWRPESYEPFGTDLVATIKAAAPQAKIMVQQTWSYTPWDRRLKEWGIDQNEMFDRLESAYSEFAKRHGLEQIYTGKAVQNYRKRLPVVYTEKTNDDDVCGTAEFLERNGKWLPKGDVFHFNARGEYLQGLVWAARLFNVDVTRSTYLPKSLAAEPERAVLMRQIASELRIP